MSNLQDNDSNGSIWLAIREVVRGLRNQPILLFAFGVVLVVLMVAVGVTTENLRLVVITALAIYIIALIGWFVYEIYKNKSDLAAKKGNRTGEVSFQGTVVSSDTKIETGGISNADDNTISETGSVTVKGGKIKGTNIKTGDIKYKK